MTVFVRQEDVAALLTAYDKGPTHGDTVKALQTMIENASIDYKTNTISVFLKDLIDPSFKDVIQIEGYCPLVNNKTYCFMNAVIQMLYSIPELRSFFINIDNETIKKANIKAKDTEIHTTDILLKTFSVLFKYLNSNKQTTIDIETIKDTLINNDKIYHIFISIFPKSETHGHKDASEFFNLLFKIFEYFTPMKSIYDTIMLTENTVFICKNKTNSSLSEIPSTETYPLGIIALPITPSNSTIQNLITEFERENILVDYKDTSDLCKDGTITSNKVKICATNHTKYIWISLKRFEQTSTDTSRTGKITSKRIDTPITPTNIITFPISNTSAPTLLSFQLKGCICNSGGVYRGHYWYILCKDGMPYLKLNDSEVKKVDSTYDLTVSGYVYLYERVNTAATAAVGGARMTRKHARSRVHAPTRKSSRSSRQTLEADKGESQTELL
jgi:ubiquitin C-terminal hydrolase